MPAVVWQDVEALQASLSVVAPAAQMIILAHVNEELNPNMFGGETSTRYHLARVFLAAHLGEIVRSNGAPQVTSKMIGTERMSIVYSKSAGNALDETTWGQQYKALLEQSPLRVGAGLCR